MPLGLAKDSLLNLTELGKDPKNESSVEDAPKQEEEDAKGDEVSEAVASPRRSEALIGDSSETSSPPKAAQEDSYGYYSGFMSDYSEYEQYQYDIFRKEETTVWCCLFPWLNQQQPKLEPVATSTTDSQQDSETGSEGALESAAPSRDEDEVSTGSEILGEKLSEKNRQAVLARLRLAQPETTAVEETTAHNKGLLNGIQSLDTNGDKQKQNIRGILKRGSSVLPAGPTPTDGPRRRSLFPSYKDKPKTSSSLNVNFQPMARVVTIQSRNEMTDSERAEIWWQRTDYDEFRKTGRLITRAMLEGGSEIWLASSQSWRKTPTACRESTLKDAYQMSKSTTREDARNKWWHKFGHSRRGLEHIASMEEGAQRQNNVKAAIRAVTDEYRRQQLYNRQDPEKLRHVSIQHTSWARDLALAAGASDADAVSSGFDDKGRHSREFYLLKLSRNTSGGNTTRHQVPKFMRPVLSMNNAAQRLDANTSAQIRYRRTTQKAKATAAATKPETPKEPAQQEPIHDPPEGPRETLADRAAGFSHDSEKVNMAAVLGGMGPIPQEQSVA